MVVSSYGRLTTASSATRGCRNPAAAVVLKHRPSHWPSSYTAMRRSLNCSCVVSRIAPCLTMLAALLAGRMSATPAVGAQVPQVAVHRIGALVHASTEPLGMGVTVRVLSDGRLLVEDPNRARLLMFDAGLEHATIVADTTAATGKAWGKGLSGLVAFAADSSLVRDQSTGAYLVLDPNGHVARIIAPPSANVRVPDPTQGGPIGYDGAGHLLFRPARPVFMLLLDQDFVGDTLLAAPDSIPILRRDLTTGALDTLVLVRGPRLPQAIRRRAQGGGSGRQALNPIPSADDWTVLDDGAVAVVRIADYHVDWIEPTRKVTSSGKLPASWVAIPHAQKVALIDSLRARDSSLRANGAFTTPNGAGLPSAVVAASDLPDYWPPFVSGTAVPATGGGLWIREGTMGAASSPPIFDVISRDGTLLDRVQLPFGTTLVAVGRGTAYLSQRTNGVTRLTALRVK